jgi:hypothetical protein
VRLPNLQGPALLAQAVVPVVVQRLNPGGTAVAEQLRSGLFVDADGRQHRLGGAPEICAGKMRGAVSAGEHAGVGRYLATCRARVHGSSTPIMGEDELPDGGKRLHLGEDGRDPGGTREASPVVPSSEGNDTNSSESGP